MSQTETLMLVALGFALALLLAMLFGRVFWNIAMRLGARRNAKMIPVQMLELQADRDRLRAEHAMMARKLELRLEDIKMRMTEQMAEVSRNRNRVQTLIQQLDTANASLANRDREVAALNAQIDVHKSDLESGLTTVNRLTSEAAIKDAEIAKLSQVLSQLTAKLRDKNGTIGRLGDELQTSLRLNPAVSPAPSTVEQGEDRIKRRIAELTSISAQLSQQAEGAPAPVVVDPANEQQSRHAALQDKLADTERESHAVSAELKALDDMLDQKLNTPQAPAEAQPEVKKSGAMANVISLAQRIRALQSGMND